MSHINHTVVAAEILGIAEHALVYAKDKCQANYAFNDAVQSFENSETKQSCLWSLRSLSHSIGINSSEYITAAIKYRDTYNEADPFNVALPRPYDDLIL